MSAQLKVPNNSAVLKTAGITVADRIAKYQGLNSNNICNRGLSGKGAQLEISRGLRDDMDLVHTLCDAVHAALTTAVLRL